MTLPSPLTPENTAALHLGGTPAGALSTEAPSGEAGAPAPTDATPVPAPSSGGVAASATRSAVARLARSRPGRAGLSLSRRVLRRLLEDDLRPDAHLEAELGAISERVDQLAERSVDGIVVAGTLEANRANLELLKAEVRGLERTLHELGMQLAPATGLAGVGARFGELREQVNAVSRRLRQLDPATGASVVALTEPPVATGDAGDRSISPMDELFDYVAFERRFRGAPEDVLREQAQRYEALLSSHEPVVDLGCGRGELAERLASSGIRVIGVEPDAGMVSEGRARGLDIRQMDAASFLRGCDDDSLGAVFSAHVAEHVPFDVLLEIVHISVQKLAPGGIFVAETPNPASLIVPSNSFILDPTHLRPIHPSLFAFVCETAGFRDVRLSFYAPAEGYHLQVPEDDGTPTSAAVRQHAERLNDVLFGPQEYAVVATKAA